jgi:hypothetical protein
MLLNQSKSYSEEDCIKVCLKNEGCLLLTTPQSKRDVINKFPQLRKQVITTNKIEQDLMGKHCLAILVSPYVRESFKELAKKTIDSFMLF